MNFVQKLFINSVVDIYSDIMTVDLESGACTYIYTENGRLEEVQLPYHWDEAKMILLDNIVPEDHERILKQWEERMTPEAEAESAFAINYRVDQNVSGRRAGSWKMNILIIENRRRKTAVIFCRDKTIDMKNSFRILNIREKDEMTQLYNHFKLEELLKTEYRNLQSCGVLYFDIIDFARLQETYGLEEKERILQNISNSIKALENENILAFRYNRDDFLIIYKNCTKDEFEQLINYWVRSWESMADKRTIQYNVALGNSWDCTPLIVNELIARAQAHMYRNKKKLELDMPMDFVLQEEMATQYGLYSRSQFVKNTTYKLNMEPKEYCIVAIDIEHFKLFNKWWGRKEGDAFLADIARKLKAYEAMYKGVAGYIGGDDFAILLPMDQEILGNLEKDLQRIALNKTYNVGFLPALGIYRIPEDVKSAEGLYDMAQEALTHVLGNYDHRSCFYDKSMTKEVEKELNIIIEAKEALERHQFYIVLQPKCIITNKRIVGAEALVRWKHPEKGMVSPGEFIPVLEKNGLISDLDLFVWEEVCRTIRSWMDNGIKPVPISINVSRIDILSMDVVDCLNKLVAKYNIDKKYLKVEITESAYVDNADKIVETVQKIGEAGFTLLMDDFGSGYSSLSMLRQSVLDILKIDMKFLDIGKDDMKKGLTILKTVIDMSNDMGLPIIVEGVETKEQAEILMKMKVRYAQGYLFYRPMQINDFEELIVNEDNVDYRGIYSKKEDTFRMNEIVDELLEQQKIGKYGKQVDLSRTPGGFISYYVDDAMELIEADRSVAQIYGCNTVEEFMEFAGHSFKGMVHPDDWERIDHDIHEQIRSTECKMDHIKYRAVRKDGGIRYIIDFGHLEEGKENNKARFQVFLLDVTEQI